MLKTLRYPLIVAALKALKLLSVLPLALLMSLRPLLYVILYHVVKYRRSVVVDNLNLVFPDKSHGWRVNISKCFYKNFSRFLLESIKSNLMPGSGHKMKHLVSYRNLELLNSYPSSRPIVLLCGHFFNWELLSTLVNWMDRRAHAIYLPLKNSYIDKQIKKARAGDNTVLIPAKEAYRGVAEAQKNVDQHGNLFLFVADQSPHWTKINYWLPFFNIPTPVFIGYDKIARSIDAAVVYCSFANIKSGYQVSFEEISPQAASSTANHIVHQFYQLLERDIIRDPANWMWSHKRWKHSPIK